MFRRTTAMVLAAYLACGIPLARSAPPGGGQTPGATPGGSASSTAAGGGSSLQGVSWANQTWDDQLGLPNIKSRVVACYALEYGNSALDPFVLQSPKTDEQKKRFDLDCKDAKTGALTTDTEGAAQCMVKDKAGNVPTKWNPCVELDADKPLKMDQTLVIGIAKPKGMSLDHVKILNLNVVNQQGVPLNPTPIRSSFSAAAASATNLSGGPYFLTWPNQMPGDVIPTVSINAVYTPPAPGTHWFSGTFYAAGSVVTSIPADGHYYTAIKGGVSADTDQPFFHSASAAQIRDGSVLWLDLGNTAPAGNVTPTAWYAGTLYNRGQVVFNSSNGHYYSNAAPGTQMCPASGVPAASTCETSGRLPVDPFGFPTITDGSVVWADRGVVAPPAAMPSPWQPSTAYALNAWIGPEVGHYFQAVQAGTSGSGSFVFPVQAAQSRLSDGAVGWVQVGCPAAAAPGWVANHGYRKGDVISASNGACYSAANDGSSDALPTQPYFGITPVQTFTLESSSAAKTLPITWADSGTTPPASVAGGQPADQTLSLMSFQLAQSHSLTYFNLASGVAYSKVQSRNFGFTGGSTTPPVPPTVVETNHSSTVDPVLLLTIYPLPIDAESHCGFRCVWNTWPGLSAGLSLTNPSTSFYAGVSFELLRNIQLVVGENWSKQAALPPASVNQGSSAINSGVPVTVQRFTSARFIGLTFNISGFVQGLFGGGGGGGGASKSGGS